MMKYFRLTAILLVFAFAAGALTLESTAASAAEIDVMPRKRWRIYMQNPQPNRW
jgi:hypothetical protein